MGKGHPRLVIKAAAASGAATEPSRGFTNDPGMGPGGATRYAPINKLRAQTRAGLGEHQAEQIAVQRMMRTTSEAAEPPRHVVVIEDVTRGLGLDQVDAQRIQKAITGTTVEFTPKTQTQRLFLARGKLTELLRSMDAVNGDQRMEIAKRATAWWKKSADTELNRSRTVHFISFSQSRMQKGGTHKYKSRKRVGGRWVYDYGDGQGHVPARGSRESVEEKRAAVRRAQEKQGTTVTAIDPERYPPIRGMEGPFRFGSSADKSLAGRTLYYDPREGKYYDRDSDMYVALEKSLTKGGKVERWITVRGARIPIVDGKMHGPVADKIRANGKKKPKGASDTKKPKGEDDEKKKRKGKKTTVGQALVEGYDAGERARVADVRALAGTVQKQRERDERVQKAEPVMAFTHPAARKIDLEWK